MNPFKHNIAVAMIILLLGSSSTATPSFGEEQSGKSVLSASVTYFENLVPPEMFGLWHRVRRVRQSNDMDYFPHIEKGAWSISRVGDHIYLMNPANGIQTQVRVKDVMNKTAVFEISKQANQGGWCQELLTLTADGDRLTGTQSKECYKAVRSEHEKPSMYFYAYADVEGRRAGDALLPLRAETN